MKFALLAVAVFFVTRGTAQQISFPGSWEGNWKGELNWYRTGTKEPEKVGMELRIHPTDKTGEWSWQIIYGSETEDNRPYTLLPKDPAGIHWVIDENNGIILDQYWVADRFCGAFTVMNSTIINKYRVEKERMFVEFYSMPAKPVNTTGKGTDEVPSVDSYKINSYQQAVLSKVN